MDSFIMPKVCFDSNPENDTSRLRNGDEPPEIAGRLDHQAEPQQEHPRETTDDPHRLARVFLAARRVNGLPTVLFWRSEWHAWEAGANRAVSKAEIDADLTAAIKHEFDRINLATIRALQEEREQFAAEEEEPATGKKKKKALPTVRHVTGSKLRDVRQALASMVMLPGAAEQPSWVEDGPAGWDARDVLSCPSGIVHLPTAAAGQRGYLRRPSPRLFTPVALAYDYTPQAPRPVTWLRLLDQLWPDDPQTVDTLQEMMGLTLTPDTRQQRILLLVGPPRSGKSTICRVWTRLVGARNVAGQTLAGLATTFGLSALLGKSLAIVTDAKLSGRTDATVVTERLLSVSGEDSLTIDRKHLPHVTTRLPARIVIVTNELPRFPDQSGALVSRLLVLKTTRSFLGQEDTTLTDRLLAELPGILKWALEGWRRLRERGRLIQPDSGRQLIAAMNDLCSPVGTFVRDCCVVEPGAEPIPRNELYSLWLQWCKSAGLAPGSEEVFGRDLRAAVPTIEDTRPYIGGVRVRCYSGIRERRAGECDPE
jgi:putative DNA primase/helicase